MDIVEKLRLVDCTFWYKPLGHGIDTDLDVPAYELGSLSHQAANEIERLRNKVQWLEMCETTVVKQDNEIERLREALKFYADKYNYRTSTVYMCGHFGPHSIDSDGGNKARAALKEGE